jgi:Leucine-rich repeat (LRR) protein
MIGNNLSGDLPPEFGNLTNLQTIDFGFNFISSLPEEIGNLTLLQSFRINDNRLTSLPSSFMFDNLNGFWIENNCINTNSLTLVVQNYIV